MNEFGNPYIFSGSLSGPHTQGGLQNHLDCCVYELVSDLTSLS